MLGLGFVVILVIVVSLIVRLVGVLLCRRLVNIIVEVLILAKIHFHLCLGLWSDGSGVLVLKGVLLRLVLILILIVAVVLVV
jgi:hypothetical protein